MLALWFQFLPCETTPSQPQRGRGGALSVTPWFVALLCVFNCRGQVPRVLLRLSILVTVECHFGLQGFVSQYPLLFNTLFSRSLRVCCFLFSRSSLSELGAVLSPSAAV